MHDIHVIGNPSEVETREVLVYAIPVQDYKFTVP